MTIWTILLAFLITALGAAATLAAALLPCASGWWPAGWRSPRGRTVAALAAVVPLVAVSALFWGSIAPERPNAREIGVTTLEPVPDVLAFTDRGSPVEIRRLHDAVAPGTVPNGYEGRLIVAGGEDALSNCHGWVFSGGAFSVAGSSVDAIPEENGYREVRDPRPMDLVIYRDDDGVPVHTGIVKATGANRFVLVESKWGQLDVYWHEPADQGYADHWEYWRSERPGHRLELMRR
jgi:hypothetical protein